MYIKNISGQRWHFQIGQVKFSGVRNFAYEAMIYTREPVPDDPTSKPLTWNMPSSLLVPLRDVLNNIIEKSALPPPPQ